MPRRLVALLAVALLGAAACGGSSDDAEGSAATEDEPAAAVTAVEVKATDFAFEPTVIEVEPGETVDVSFTNAGNVAHTLTAEDVDFDHEAAVGNEVKAAFTAPDEDATIEFVCRLHPSQMTGQIVVGDGGSGSGGGGSSEEDSDTFDY